MVELLWKFKTISFQACIFSLQFDYFGFPVKPFAISNGTTNNCHAHWKFPIKVGPRPAPLCGKRIHFWGWCFPPALSFPLPTRKTGKRGKIWLFTTISANIAGVLFECGGRNCYFFSQKKSLAVSCLWNMLLIKTASLMIKVIILLCCWYILWWYARKWLYCTSS